MNMTCEHTWTKRLLEGFEEVWVEFTCLRCDKEVGVELCSLDDLLYDQIGTQIEIEQRLADEIGEHDE